MQRDDKRDRSLAQDANKAASDRGHEGHHEEGFDLSESEKDDVAEKLPPRATVLHETIRVQGEAELARSATALAWSALAAGLSMGFSMLVRALIHAHMADTPGRFLVENLGYTVGFVIVVMARQQLFTENTMTAVLPMMTNPSGPNLRRLLRLHVVVLIGNLVGVALFAWGAGHMRLFDDTMRQSMLGLGVEIMHNSAWQMFTKGIVAGWLIATMVWLVPAAEQSRIFVIVLMTYLIGIGGFTHIIAGSTEVLYLVYAGGASFGDYVGHFALPTLAGNIVGGSLIFALISHAQVRSDDGNGAFARDGKRRRHGHSDRRG